MNGSLNFKEKTFLLIVGQPKAGTTSLFGWLKEHPDICGAKLKEARFFLDEDYPLRRPLAFNGTNLDAYADLFEESAKSVLMEASPDYLYCETPLRVANLLPNARAVIIVRDPVERMISAFRFFKQRGLISTKMSFDEYIALQDECPVCAGTPVQYRALDHCRIRTYLSRWEAAFGERLLVLDFKDLKRSPLQVIERVCAFIGIAMPVVDERLLVSENRSGRARSPGLARLYYALNRELGMAALKLPLLRRLLRPINRILKRGLIDDGPLETFKPSDHAVEVIRAWADR